MAIRASFGFIQLVAVSCVMSCGSSGSSAGGSDASVTGGAAGTGVGGSTGGTAGTSGSGGSTITGGAGGTGNTGGTGIGGATGGVGGASGGSGGAAGGSGGAAGGSGGAAGGSGGATGGTGGGPCVPGTKQTVPCGKCGQAENTCPSSGQWQAGPCLGEGECVIGTQQTKPCGPCNLGTSHEFCDSTCKWVLGGCAVPPTACSPTEVKAGPTACPNEFDIHAVTCQSNCSWGSPAATCSQKPTGWRFMTPLTSSSLVSYQVRQVWSGQEMLLFGRSNGGAENIRMGYNPQTDTWRKLALDPVGQREGHIAVWTGSRMFTWGGKSIYSSQSQCNADGASYDPTTNTWEVVPAPVGSNPPKCRNFAVAVWSPTTGEVLIWGGKDLAGHLADGDAYKPATKTWRSLPAAPIAAREAAGGFFAGGKLHVFGGYGAGFLADGASFDPVANTWQKLPAAPTLTPRIHHLAVADSSGSAGAFWGGSGSPASTYFGDGMVFDGTTSSWTDISPPPTNVVPVAPREYSGGWFASGKLWFFGGRGLLNSYDLAIQDGAAYDVATKTWSAIPPGGPSSSLFMTPPLLVWTGSEAIVIAANYVGDNTTHGRIYRP